MTETYTVDSGDKLTQVSVSGVPTKTFGYDGAGRTTSIQTSAGTTSFTYDFESRVTGITYPNASTNSFAYNGLDTRVGKTDSAGTATFRRMGAGVTAPVLGDGSASFTPGISERRGSTSSFYGADYLGTNSSLYSSGETVSATRQYDAFGNLTSSSGSSANPFGFAGNWGYQNDSDSGLKLLGHRYYDASTGRFLTRDPIKDGRNWYSYCGSDPVQWVDPEGLWRRVACSVLGGVLGFVLTGGNPLGAMAGSALGSTLGDAADQAAEYGEVDMRQALTAGLVDGAISYAGGAVTSAVVKRMLAMKVSEGGLVTFVHYTTPTSLPSIMGTRLIKESGPGLGSSGGHVYGWPSQNVPKWYRTLFGAGDQPSRCRFRLNQSIRTDWACYCTEAKFAGEVWALWIEILVCSDSRVWDECCNC